MKSFFVLMCAFAFTLTLTGCEKDENNRYFDGLGKPVQSFAAEMLPTPEDSTSEPAFAEPAWPAAKEPSEASSATEEKPEYVGDIHNWFAQSELYNINDTYEPTDRYDRTFRRLDQSAALWYGNANAPLSDVKYDPVKALEYADGHWDDGLDYCAPFVSRCFEAGGLPISSDSSTALLFMLVNSGLGVGQFMPMNDDGTITLPGYASPGDFVGIYCHCEGLMVHSTLYAGNDRDGKMRAYAHNPPDGAENTFRYRDECKSCATPFKEAFFFHFYSGDETRKSTDILLSESAGYVIPNQRYDREKAVAAAQTEPIIDGLGLCGAEQTSAALTAGGLDVGSPIHSAIFIQLMRSRLGAVYSIPVNPDRTVTLPEFAKEGDVCFLCCSEEWLIFSSFIVGGADENGKLLGYTRDRLNDENTAFRAESVCPSATCDGAVAEILLFHFN